MNLPPLPARMEHLPRDARGYPVPWFVYIDPDGVPDFRIVGPGKHEAAHKFERCWVCGGQRGRNFSFVVGPMCAVNRTSGEPPCHLDCAMFSAIACPFLVRPKMKRDRVNSIPDGSVSSPSGLERNPGVALVWNTRSYRLVRGTAGEPIYRIGEPQECLWFCQGRPATRDEVLTSIESGLPLLEASIEHEAPEDREPARVHLKELAAVAMQLVPA